MSYKVKIAILLIYIFVGKSLAVDAKGLNNLLDPSIISFYNPYCKKVNNIKSSHKPIQIDQNETQNSQSIIILSFCNNEFKFEFSTLKFYVFKHVKSFNKFIISRLLYLYLDQDSPPPRLF